MIYREHIYHYRYPFPGISHPYAGAGVHNEQTGLFNPRWSIYAFGCGQRGDWLYHEIADTDRLLLFSDAGLHAPGLFNACGG